MARRAQAFDYVRARVRSPWRALAMFAALGVTAAQTPHLAAASVSGARLRQFHLQARGILEVLAVAPIALYPDSVLSQVLMASTYPLEIV